jgi:hypothetical protein
MRKAHGIATVTKKIAPSGSSAVTATRKAAKPIRR